MSIFCQRSLPFRVGSSLHDRIRYVRVSTTSCICLLCPFHSKEKFYKQWYNPRGYHCSCLSTNNVDLSYRDTSGEYFGDRTSQGFQGALPRWDESRDRDGPGRNHRQGLCARTLSQSHTAQTSGERRLSVNVVEVQRIYVD